MTSLESIAAEKLGKIGKALVVDAARVRAEGRGETLERPPSFFHLHARDEANNGFVPIDRVVSWARTSHGGRQQDMWPAEQPDAGCMRWGLCETEDAPDELRGRK